MNKKYIVLILIAVGVLGFFIFYLYNNNLQQQREIERLEPKTLTLNPYSILITSIDNDGSQYVCKYPESKTSWTVNVRVDFSEIHGSFPAWNTGGYGTLDYRDLGYLVHQKYLKIDGNNMPVKDFSVIRDRNTFDFGIYGLSPTESHVLETTFTLEEITGIYHITSTPVDITYSIPKFC